jgi:hypothetical protein
MVGTWEGIIGRLEDREVGRYTVVVRWEGIHVVAKWEGIVGKDSGEVGRYI